MPKLIHPFQIAFLIPASNSPVPRRIPRNAILCLYPTSQVAGMVRSSTCRIPLEFNFTGLQPTGELFLLSGIKSYLGIAKLTGYHPRIRDEIKISAGFQILVKQNDQIKSLTKELPISDLEEQVAFELPLT